MALFVLFYGLVIFHYIYHIFIIHSSIDRLLGCFHVLAIVNSAAMNIGVHVSFWNMVFSGYMPRSRIVGSSVQFSSVTQSCPTICDPMDCSMPGLPDHHQLPEITQTHVHWVGDAIQPPHPLSSLSPPAFLQSFPALGFFQMSQLFMSGGQSIAVSASASVLPMNIQDWFPLGWTGWISLQSKGLSRVFSNITV